MALPPHNRHGPPPDRSFSARPIGKRLETRWPNPKTAPPQGDSCSAAQPAPSIGRSGDLDELSSKALEKGRQPRQKPSSRQSPCWRTPLRGCEGALVGREFVTRGRVAATACPGRRRARGWQQGRPRQGTARAKTPATAPPTLAYEASSGLRPNKLTQQHGRANYKATWCSAWIFLKYISDSFEEHRVQLARRRWRLRGAPPEDPDEYIGRKRVSGCGRRPAGASWQGPCQTGHDRKAVDDAMGERSSATNPRPRGCLPKDYARAWPRQAAAWGNWIDVSPRSNSPRPSEGEGLSCGRAIAPWICWAGVRITSSPAFAFAEGQKQRRPVLQPIVW